MIGRIFRGNRERPNAPARPRSVAAAVADGLRRMHETVAAARAGVAALAGVLADVDDALASRREALDELAREPVREDPRSNAS